MSEKKKGDELLDRSDVFEEIQLPKLDWNRSMFFIIIFT